MQDIIRPKTFFRLPEMWGVRILQMSVERLLTALGSPGFRGFLFFGAIVHASCDSFQIKDWASVALLLPVEIRRQGVGHICTKCGCLHIYLPLSAAGLTSVSMRQVRQTWSLMNGRALVPLSTAMRMTALYVVDQRTHRVPASSP